MYSFSEIGFSVYHWPEPDVRCRVYDEIPGCAAAVCSKAEQPPERLRFVEAAWICT